MPPRQEAVAHKRTRTIDLLNGKGRQLNQKIGERDRGQYKDDPRAVEAAVADSLLSKHNGWITID